MTHSRLSAEFEAEPGAIWELVGNIGRWPEWDVTYQNVEHHGLDTRDPDVQTLEHRVGSRTMAVDFRVDRVEPDKLFVVEGHGGEGEQIDERFEMERNSSGGTTVTRETTYTLPGPTLGVAASTTFAEASVQRWAEQAFARLGHALGDASRAHPARRPGDVDTRSTDSGPISADEGYSANLDGGRRLPQEPGAQAPERPT